MREIKFRCWVVRDSEDDEEVIPYMGDMREVESYINPFEEQRKGNIILMQWIGLKDRNGTDIYEGDILKVPDWYDLPENTSMTYNNQVVSFAECSFLLDGSPMHENHEYISEECEVIGNVYENPKILEEATV